MMLHTSSGACRSESSTMVLQPVSQTILHISLTVFSSGTWVTMKALHCLYPCNRHHVTVIATPEQKQNSGTVERKRLCIVNHMIVDFLSSANTSCTSIRTATFSTHTLSISLSCKLSSVFCGTHTNPAGIDVV